MSLDILHTPIEKLTQTDFECECGHRHTIRIGTIDIGPEASAHVPALAAPYFAKGPVLVVCDCHTYEVLGRKVTEDLIAAGAQTDCYVFPEQHLHPDAFALGRLFLEASDETKNYALLIAVGSGTLNDITRLVSGRLGLPYFIVGTAPSMDGYAGNSSPIVCRDTKMSFYSHYADAIVADTTILSQAPSLMLAAGLGDVLGKYVSLADWKLGADLKNEYRCEKISQFMANAVEKCAASAADAAKRDPQAVGAMMEALVLAGMSMGLAGVTRPASGCEHHITHYMDVHLIRAGLDYPLHGNSVGVSAIAMLRFYELARRDGLTKLETPPPAFVADKIRAVGGPTDPAGLGVTPELFREALLNAMNLRPQYSMLKHVAAAGKLEEYTDIVMKEMC